MALEKQSTLPLSGCKNSKKKKSLNNVECEYANNQFFMVSFVGRCDYRLQHMLIIWPNKKKSKYQ